MYQPAIIGSGIPGWKLLQGTYDTQMQSFRASPRIARDADYFRANIAEVTTAEELVSDRRLLTVALGAFGLQDDIGNRYFIQKMLEEGTLADDALANKLADKRYKSLVEAFGFGPGEVRQTALSDFADRIVADFEAQSFEAAVGEIDGNLRIALNAERALDDLAQSPGSETRAWFEVLGQPPLRQLFQTALGLPTSFAQIDIDQQQEVMAYRLNKAFATTDPRSMADPEARETLVTRFLAMSQITGGAGIATPQSTALTLLRGG